LIGLLCCLFLASVALADSTYGLDELAILGGGKPAQAGAYEVQRFAIGQAVVGDSSSSDHDLCTGLLCSSRYRVYLPVVFRDYS
jgi:hypothetical protein